MATTKFLLDESKMPTHWYNIAADLAVPAGAGAAPGHAAAGGARTTWRRCSRWS